MKVLLNTRPNFGLGSRHHGYVRVPKLQGINFTKWFLPQGNYLLGKLLCTVGSYFPGVSTILTLILIISGPLSSTFASASVRIRQAYAEGSRCSYYNKFNILLSFSIHYKLNVKRLTVNNCISFLEILANSGLSTATIATYISAIKAKCSAFGIG